MSLKRDKQVETRHLVNHLFRKPVYSTIFTKYMPEELVKVITKYCSNKFAYFESQDYFKSTLTVSDVTKKSYDHDDCDKYMI